MRIYEVYEDRGGKFHFFVLEDALTTPKCVAAFCGLEITPENNLDLLAALSACWKDGDAWQSWNGAEHPPSAPELYKSVSRESALVAWLSEEEMIIHLDTDAMSRKAFRAFGICVGA